MNILESRNSFREMAASSSAGAGKLTSYFSRISGPQPLLIREPPPKKQKRGPGRPRKIQPVTVTVDISKNESDQESEKNGRCDAGPCMQIHNFMHDAKLECV